MKNQLQNFSLIGLLLMLIMASCTIEKRVHLAGYNIEWKQWSNKNKSAVTDKVKNIQQNKIPVINVSQDAQTIFVCDDKTSESVPFNFLSVELNPEIQNFKLLQKKPNINLDTLEKDCDIIILKNGQEIMAKVLEIGPGQIKYKTCDNLNGPTYTKYSWDVFMIKYPNGTKTVISEDDKTNNQNSSDSKIRTEPLSIISFIFSIIGLFIFGIIFGVAAAVLSIIGIKKINDQPLIWRGNGWAIAGFIIGVVDIIGALIVITMLK